MTSSISLPNTFFFLFFLFFPVNVATGATSFDFKTFSLTSLKFLGDAHIFKSSVRLTRDLLVPNSGAGMVLYNKPVRFRCPWNETPASFTSFFSFTILNLNPDSIGGGLAFVISPNDEAIGDVGGYLGIPTGSVAVEFDTFMDIEFKDVNGNHVGLDLNSTVSTQVEDLDSVNVNLRSGDLVNSWVEYSGKTRQLAISISHGKQKPESPVLSISINLNEYINEFMFVGFTGSTEGSTEIHLLEWWSFTSCFDEQQPLPPPPTKTTLTNPSANVYNPPPLSVPSENSNKPKTKKKNKGCKKCGWALGFVGLIVIAVTVNWYIGSININCINSCFNKYS